MKTKVYDSALRQLMQQDGMGTMVMRRPLKGDNVRVTLLLTMGHATFSWAYDTKDDEADDITATNILAYLIDRALCEVSQYPAVVDPLRLFLDTRIEAYVAATRLELS